MTVGHATLGQSASKKPRTKEFNSSRLMRIESLEKSAWPLATLREQHATRFDADS
ncbi:MAG: hypothetical protein F6K50_18495 [Moorea sp. SIO3I7]|uniref:hypothetical protein n=1 Tax=unclassified Moorena TaxID=2683338 RepID=UPI0013C5C08F|nr:MULTISPECIES: hypothetical protein [unclassified Moorena]NEN97439.1 hypothetical protein [Moorena sp. SIO3I7]NEO23376.1 hypothetical protein [Moorena sp. SIO4A5]NEQ56925.1 hypothetical protein [Moorena sp. SIO4A1]